MGFYRDDLLGAEFTGNAFTCEPVNQLVHRMVLKPNGTTFIADRAADEAETEFLTSTDNWFRPVEARTAPDGSLWIVDMHRYVIEHSRWIPQNVQDELDVYAGNNLGRIYRVLPKDAKPRPWPRLDKLEHRELVAALDSTNGWQRDMAQQLLVSRHDDAAVQPLTELGEKRQAPGNAHCKRSAPSALLEKLPDGLIIAALVRLASRPCDDKPSDSPNRASNLRRNSRRPHQAEPTIPMQTSPCNSPARSEQPPTRKRSTHSPRSPHVTATTPTCSPAS